MKLTDSKPTIPAYPRFICIKGGKDKKATAVLGSLWELSLSVQVRRGAI